TEVIISRTIRADNFICFNSICIRFEKLFDKFIHHIVAVMNVYSPDVWDNHRHIKYAGIKKNGKATGISNDRTRFFLMSALLPDVNLTQSQSWNPTYAC